MDVKYFTFSSSNFTILSECHLSDAVIYTEAGSVCIICHKKRNV